MIRKVEFLKWIENYLSDQLTFNEKKIFEEELKVNKELRDEYEFQCEVYNAIFEDDVIGLRETLNSLTMTHETNPKEKLQGSFDLVEELDSFNEFDTKVDPKELLNYYDSLPKIHVYQHEIASKENIHHFYNEQKVAKVEIEDEDFDTDEALMAEIEAAILEKEVVQLRESLNQITHALPEHNVSDEQIEKYLEGTLSQSERIELENEMKVNSKLVADINLHRNLEAALQETEVMALRTDLNRIIKTQTSHTQEFVDIEKFIDNELVGKELASFEDEFYSNKDLKSDVKLHKEVEYAIGERDIIDLRDHLEEINKNAHTSEGKSIIMLRPNLSSTFMKRSLAASILILVGLTAMLRLSPVDSEKLYNKYYETYPSYGISRTASSDMDQNLKQGLLLFGDKNYAEALGVFKSIIENDTENSVARFYAGQSYQNLDKNVSAINEYKTVVDHNENLFVEQAEWYMSLCLIKEGNKQLASEQLNTIVANNGYYKKDAKALLRKIKYIE